MRYLSLLFIAFAFLQSCNADSKSETPSNQNDSLYNQRKDAIVNDSSASAPAIADAATILAKKEVPVLCYHDIRDLRPGESQRLKEYIVGESNFIEQMQSLKDSGYQTISLDDYYDYLTTGKALPAKPIIVTFDDTDLEQYTVGARELEKHGFRGTYFIMTISIGRPRYMSSEQIRDLADKGHTIATHTWDHHKVTKYTEEDWDKQITFSKEKIEKITGKPVTYFAYPFGIWDSTVFDPLKKRGIKAAFQLSAKRNTQEPLYTLRRTIVHGAWSTPQMHRYIRGSFK